MGIVSPYNVLNVKVIARVRRAYTYSDVHIWLLYTHVTMYTILGLLRGSFTVHVYDRKYHIHISYPSIYPTYIDDIESKYLQNEIDYSNFNQEEFDNVKICKYCDCEFNHPYNDRYIILYEICDKEKLKYILENNDFNEEVNNLARNYYDSLDNDGCKRIVYRQTCDKNRYYADSSCLTYLKKEIRNSIMPKDIKDIDMVNAHPVILNYLCKKNNVECNILKNYIENRELILSSVVYIYHFSTTL